MLTRRTILAATGAALPASLAIAGGPTLDASEIGLRPHSSDDQSAILSEALLAAQKAGQPLYLPPGRYRVSNLDLPPDAQLYGLPGESVLAYGGGDWLLRARGGQRLRLKGLTLDGGGLAFAQGHRGLADLSGIGDLAISDCRVLNSHLSGIRVEACGGLVRRCRVEQCRAVGIHVLDCAGVTVSENDIRDSGNTGIMVQQRDKGEDRSIVHANRIANTAGRSGGTGQYGNGINLVQANGVTVTNNQVDMSFYSGIRVFSSNNSQITGNTLTRSGEVALYVEFAFEGAVVANNIVEDAAFGIAFANLQEYGGRLGICSGNLVRNIRTWIYSEKGRPEGTGIGIGVEADIAVTGNVIEDAARIGLALGWGPYMRDITATGNVVRNSDTGISVSVVEGAGPALIANNLVTGARSGDIVGMRWSEVATGDLAKDGAAAYPHLTLG